MPKLLISVTRRFVLAALLLVQLAAQCANPSKADPDTRTLRVFIFAGQSNMEGAGRAIALIGLP